jgi:hypothetical protein
LRKIKLNFRQNNINDQTGFKLGDAIERLDQLHVLDLQISRNAIKSNGLNNIFKSLRTLPNMSQLTIDIMFIFILF